MSSKTDDFPSISFQKSIISGNLNATLVFLFLSGIYIGFSIFTLVIYFRSQRRLTFVIATLAGLFITTVVQSIVQWYYTSHCFVGKPKNRLETYVLSVESDLSPVVSIFVLISQAIGQILADSLLVWRCWQFLSQHRYIKLGLACLYFTELGNAVSILITTSFEGLLNFVPEDRTILWAQRFNIIQGISYCTTAVTSVLATFIIAAKIHRSGINNRARRRYRHIIEITAQTSALYTLSVLGNAVTTLVDNGNLNLQGSTLLNAQAYITGFTLIATAFAPTLMVARIEWAKRNPTEEFSTNSISYPPDVELSAFAVATQPRSGSEIQEISREGTAEEIQTSEA